MKKQSWFLLLAALFTAVLLCGCSQYDSKYDDEAFLTDEENHYMAIMCGGNVKSDGTYSMHAGSFSGVQSLRSFTVQENDSLCEVDSTLVCTKGKAKLLVVNAQERTLVAQWPLDSQAPLSLTLPAGQYELRVAGQSAGYEGNISLFLNGQISAWDDGQLLTWNDEPEELQASAEQALTSGWEKFFRGAVDSLRESMENEQNAA
ncbi:hypothetical protein H6B10_06235 [Gemmiger formicilis]|uniref:hypothetical protein n=1 Tax=Gemmiger formicilis TaxID=745368 RepID=UPI001956D489|nr:hypothetical protein [Gemmiger formicilis]MBM6899304.1 hypothetical protein [Gemmiger formicilis]